LHGYREFDETLYLTRKAMLRTIRKLVCFLRVIANGLDWRKLVWVKDK